MEVAKIVLTHFTNSLPSKLTKFFTLTKNIFSRATRATKSSHDTLYIPRYSTIRLQRSTKYQGVKFWNNIPPEIQNSLARLFKNKYKNIYYKIIGKIYTAALLDFCCD